MALENVDIFNVSDMEVVMRGGNPSTTSYRYSSAGSIGRGTLSEAEKSKIRNYTTLNTSDFVKKCNDLSDTASTVFTEVIKELRDLKDKCGEDAFSLNGETLQDEFEEIAKKMEEYILQISEYTDALISRGKTISTKQSEVCENTIRWMNKLYESQQPKLELYNPKK